jgi:L-ectoine synthase
MRLGSGVDESSGAAPRSAKIVRVIVRSIADIDGTERDVRGEGWRSLRLLLRDDGLGFSVSETTVAAGTELELEYRHHLEACYCLDGQAEVTDLASGQRHLIQRGTVYALDGHDRHRLRVEADLRLVCIFSPALTGRETHDATGGYPPPAD